MIVFGIGPGKYIYRARLWLLLAIAMLITKVGSFGFPAATRRSLRSLSSSRVADAVAAISSRRDGIGMPKGASIDSQFYKLEKEQLSGLPTKSPYLVLGIESSCDDTGVGVVSSDGRILSNVVFSQHEIHNKFGGVVPGLAMDAHKANIDIAVEQALAQAGLSSVHDVDAIAVTKGPGLEICLRVGMRKAQKLATDFNKPFVTVHHHEAHCLTARLAGVNISSSSHLSAEEAIVARNSNSGDSFQPKIHFPFLAVLASGGHTSLMLCRGIGDYEMLGGTLDDALGEGFDKAARLLGLHSDSTGGPAVEKLAKWYRDNEKNLLAIESSRPYNYSHSMRPPMRTQPNCDFSYAGLKNAFRMEVLKFRTALGLDANNTNAPAGQLETTGNVVSLPQDVAGFLCHAYQDVAFTHLEDRLKRALQFVTDKANNKRDNRGYAQIQGLVVVGGVAANMELRR